MIIGGYQKLTLIDYPGKLATTVFTVGCNFRCPFCHNPELVDLKLVHNEESEKEFLDFLKKRKGKLEGVCITGGEPLIQPDIVDFIKKIKKLGFLVKLDTNGARPDLLKKIIDARLIDYIAMDIKNQLKNYSKTTNTKVDKERIKLSVDLIMHSRLPYEFRTTVVPGIHTEKDFEEIAKWIHPHTKGRGLDSFGVGVKGAPAYYLQEYREGKILDPKLKKKTKGKTLNLENIKKKIEKKFGKVEIRR